ncbi:MAG: hypothetical protein PHD32_05560 [Eubacteriales bacterium]|nr:hypothetical protein [Eubacteriales bacterium]
MPLFYSTFVPGLEEPTQRLFQWDMPGCSIEKVLSGAVQYRRKGALKAPPSWLNNTFLSLTTFARLDKNPLQEMVRIADTRGIDADTLTDYLPPEATTFRALFMENGAVAHVGPKTLERAETMLTIFSGLTVDRAHPDVEFWFIYRPEGCGFLLLRLTGHTRGKNPEPGEVRADIASYLCRLCDPLPGMTLLVPSAGHGAIPSAALEYPFEKIVVCENAPRAVQELNARFAACPQVSPLLCAAPALPGLPGGAADRMIAFLQPEEAGKAEISAYYLEFLASARRCLKKGGRLVMLCPDTKEALSAVRSTLTLADFYEVVTAGRKLALVVCEK